MIKLHSENGSAVAYMFLALFLAGLLISNMVSESNVATTNVKLQDVKNNLRADLNAITAGINECILLYPDPVDLDSDGDTDEDDNPNAPYPVYNDDSTGSAGDVISDIKCPGSDEEIFTTVKGIFFKLLDDTTKYTTTYYNDDTEGVKVVIDYSIDSSTWDEALAQIAASQTTGTVTIDSTTGTCAIGSCLEYLIKSYCDLTLLNVGEGCGGLIYAGSYGGNRLYTTTDDQGEVFWSVSTTTTGAQSSNDGAANTATLSGLSDTTYPANDLCTALGAKWYLPAVNELNVLYSNRNTGNLSGTFDVNLAGWDSVYWSSSEDSGNPAVVQIVHFHDTQSYGNWSKGTAHNVRCVRND